MTVELFLQMFVALMVPFALWVLRDMKRQIADRRDETRQLRDELNERDKEHRTAVEKLHEMLPRQYVLRDDYVRTMASMDNKLDLLITEVRAVAQNLHNHVESEAGA